MTETPIPMTLLQAVLWRRHDDPSLEHSRFMEFFAGHMIDGRVLTVDDGKPCEVYYTVHCDQQWTTLGAYVHIVQGASTRRVQLRRDEDNHWWKDEERVPQLDGILDVDFALTPATNTLAIRRLALEIGESRQSDAAWISFPELILERLPQRYTRLAERSYRYESDGGAFVTEIHVDEQGVVIRYGDTWERIAASHATR